MARTNRIRVKNLDKKTRVCVPSKIYSLIELDELVGSSKRREPADRSRSSSRPISLAHYRALLQSIISTTTVDRYSRRNSVLNVNDFSRRVAREFQSNVRARRCGLRQFYSQREIFTHPSPSPLSHVCLSGPRREAHVPFAPSSPTPRCLSRLED